ncbi:MAG: serine protease [Thermoplasmatota archaeon]
MSRPLAMAMLLMFALAGCIETGASDNEPQSLEQGASSEGPVGPDSQRAWAAPEDATIRPGVRIYAPESPGPIIEDIDGACTSNFIFTDPNGTNVYIGFAAHCDQSLSPSDDCLHGNGALPRPIGSPVRVEGASQPATIAYSSWGTMMAVNETDPETCDRNDFAVALLHPDDVAAVSPAMIYFGGPVGLPTEDPEIGTSIVTFGNTPLRPGPEELDRKEGSIVAQESSGWTHYVRLNTPGVSGDSGSGVLSADGLAVGALVAVVPIDDPDGQISTETALTNLVVDLRMALDYAREHAGLELELATWHMLV